MKCPSCGAEVTPESKEATYKACQPDVAKPAKAAGKPRVAPSQPAAPAAAKPAAEKKVGFLGDPALA